MFRLLNNIGIRFRMLISVSLFIATLFFAMYNAYESVGTNVEFATQEKLGDYYQQPLSKILYSAGQLRMAVAEKSTNGVDALVSEINSQMSVLKEAQDVAGEKLQFTEQGLSSRGRENLKYETVAAKWSGLASSVKSPTPDVEATLVSFIADIRGMIAHSGDTSNLILDPDLDSYYLMDVTLLALPQSLDRLAEIGSWSSAQLSGASGSADLGPQPAKFSKESEIQFAVYSHLMAADDMGRIVADFDTSFKEDGNFYGMSDSYKPHVQPLLDDYQAKNKALIETLDKLAAGDAVSEADFHSVWKGALDSAYALWAGSYTELDILLDNRIASYKAQQMKGITYSIAGIILSMIFYQIMVQSLISPLTALSRTMTDLTNQKLDIEVPYMGVSSEIGQIADAVDVFKNNALENKRLEVEKIELAEKSKREREEMMKSLATSFEKRIQGIIDAVTSASVELSSSSKSMGASVSQSNNHALGAANDAQETCNNVQSVAAAMEEMSATIQEISSQTQKANQVISLSMQKVSGADVHANQLRQATQKVRDVINLISGIASQINLLALNATIESARAGEAGKGFSVVASEVRNLAGQTDKSIQEIEKVIADMNEAAGSVINALDSIKASVEEINISSCGVASAVEEQSAVVNDIAQNMNAATQKTLMVKDSIQTVGTLSTQAEQSSQQILKAVSNLSVQASQLDTEVASFLSELN